MSDEAYMDDTPTHNSGLPHSTEFPSSMLTDRSKLAEVREKLIEAIKETIPDPNEVSPGFEGKQSNNAMKKMVDCNEVYPDIILGDGSTAKNKKYLKMIGVTHVVNASYGDSFGLINTDEKFYQPDKIKFLGLRVIDLPGAKISNHFEKAADFIENALASGGKVYVHCVMGVSRSSTIVIAFLMLKRGYTAENALRLVRSKRFVLPNDGFLIQLANLDLKLAERRELASNNDEIVLEKLRKKKPCQVI